MLQNKTLTKKYTFSSDLGTLERGNKQQSTSLTSVLETTEGGKLLSSA